MRTATGTWEQEHRERMAFPSSQNLCNAHKKTCLYTAVLFITGSFGDSEISDASISLFCAELLLQDHFFTCFITELFIFTQFNQRVYLLRIGCLLK